MPLAEWQQKKTDAARKRWKKIASAYARSKDQTAVAAKFGVSTQTVRIACRANDVPVLPLRVRAEPDRSALGQKIFSAREASGLTATEAAKKLGWTWREWSRYERGEREPSATRMFAIAGALGVSADSLRPDESAQKK